MRCFYHSDHDGHCAAFWVHKRYPVMMEEDFIEINYGYDFKSQVLDKVHSGEDVIIVDFSFEPDEMKMLLKFTDNIIWIDHHKSAIEKYNDFDHEIKGIRYDGIAGCMLTYIYFHELKEYTDEFSPSLRHKAPWMTKYVSDYDVWKYEYGDETAHFILGLDAVEKTGPFDPIWEQLLAYHNNVVKLIENGEIIEKYNTARFQKCLSRGFEYTLDGRSVYCQNNIFGNSINFLDKIKEFDACLQFYFDGNMWQYSLYSEKIDCTQVHICDKQFAGHPGASGAQSKYLFTEYKGE